MYVGSSVQNSLMSPCFRKYPIYVLPYLKKAKIHILVRFRPLQLSIFIKTCLDLGYCTLFHGILAQKAKSNHTLEVAKKQLCLDCLDLDHCISFFCCYLSRLLKLFSKIMNKSNTLSREFLRVLPHPHQARMMLLKCHLRWPLG